MIDEDNQTCPYCQVGITDVFYNQKGYVRKCRVCELVTDIPSDTKVQVTTGQILALRNVLHNAGKMMAPYDYKILVQRWDAIMEKIMGA